MNDNKITAAFNNSQPQNLMVPTVVVGDRNGGRAWDIESYLLDKGIIYFTGEVNDVSCTILKQQIQYLDTKDTVKEIKIFIDSPGGAVYSGQSAIDAATYANKDITTIAAGMAASMGSILLVAGAPGKRFAYPNAQIMIHQPSGGGRVNEAEAKESARQLKNIRYRGDAYYAFAMGLDPKKEEVVDMIHKLMDSDKYLNALEAEKLGLIDKILPLDPTIASTKSYKRMRFENTQRLNQEELDEIGSTKHDHRSIVKEIIAYRAKVIAEAAENPAAITNPYLKFAVDSYLAEKRAPKLAPTGP